MRGLKAKTLRRVARNSKVPGPTAYVVREHHRTIFNPAFGKTPTEPIVIPVVRHQVLLANCQRKFVKRMKVLCPKGSFFGVPLDFYRNGGVPKGLRNATIQIIEAPTQ